MSLSKTHYSLLNTSLTQEDLSRNNLKIVEWYVKYQIKTKVNMCGSGNFRQGWPRSIWHIKKTMTTLLVLILFNRRPTVTFIECYHFRRLQSGSKLFQGDPTISRWGFDCLFPIETNITCDFPGWGDPDPCPSTLDPPMFYIKNL